MYLHDIISIERVVKISEKANLHTATEIPILFTNRGAYVTVYNSYDCKNNQCSSNLSGLDNN